MSYKFGNINNWLKFNIICWKSKQLIQSQYTNEYCAACSRHLSTLLFKANENNKGGSAQWNPVSLVIVISMKTWVLPGLLNRKVKLPYLLNPTFNYGPCVLTNNASFRLEMQLDIWPRFYITIWPRFYITKSILQL